jgi:hypothetical protein
MCDVDDAELVEYRAEPVRSGIPARATGEAIPSGVPPVRQEASAEA